MMHVRPLAAALVLTVAAAAPAGAQTTIRPAPAPFPGTISVVGYATVSRTPDRAHLGFTVTTNAPDAKAATTDNNVRYAAARSRLVALGIPATAIVTASLNINNNPRPAVVDGRISQRYGYIVTRNVEVTIDDVGVVGAAIDATVDGGVTDVTGVNFGFRDERAVMRAAQSAAMADAVAQAQNLAQSGHFRLGGVLTVGNTPTFAPAPALNMIGRVQSRSADAAPYAPPTDVTPNPVSVSATIPVTWRIAP